MVTNAASAEAVMAEAGFGEAWAADAGVAEAGVAKGVRVADNGRRRSRAECGGREGGGEEADGVGVERCERVTGRGESADGAWGGCASRT